MITLTRLDKREIVINADEIETVDTSYDTTITLISGKKFVVSEDAQTIIEKVISYRQECFSKVLIEYPKVKKDEE